MTLETYGIIAQYPRTVTLLCIVTLGVGCTDSGDDSPSVGSFVNGLPPWSEIAYDDQPRTELEEGVEHVNEDHRHIVEQVTFEQPNPDPDDTDPVTTVTKVCTTERVDFYDTPEKYVMFQPPTNILYPGALVVGQSLLEGNSVGDILPIDVAQRSPVDVTIRSCSIPNNRRTVEPTLAAVNSAVSAILFEAEGLNQDCATPTGSFTIETFRDAGHLALKAGLSARYFGFSASASGSLDKDVVENSVAATFTESLYTVDVSAPQTPSDWFTSEFTPDLMQEQIMLGTMGMDNVPAYVSRITYGRMLTVKMTSTHSETDMRAALQFKYQNPVGGIEGSAAARSAKVRDDSSIAIAYIGGAASATASMIQSEDWTEYFGTPVKASDAMPISIEIRSISDNKPAVVQELTSYDRHTCLEGAENAAVFEFLPEQRLSAGFRGAGQRVAMGDVDGRHGDDIVWAATGAGSRGQIAIALSNGDGTFRRALLRGEHTGATTTTGEFDLLLTDVDDDGRKDIILNARQSGESTGANMVYVMFVKDGVVASEFESAPILVYSAPQQLDGDDGTDWSSFVPRVAQMDGARGGEIVWNNTPNSITENITFVATAVDTTVPGFDLTTDPLFTMGPRIVVVDETGIPRQNFSGYEYTHVADFNGDGRDDLIWQNIDVTGNRFYAALGTPSGLDFRPYNNFSLESWSQYVSLAGDVNGDGRADLIEPAVGSGSSFDVYIGEGNSVGTGAEHHESPLIAPHVQKPYVPDEALFAPARPPDAYLADVDGNGTKDLLLNNKGYGDGVTNSIGVGLALVGSSELVFRRAPQSVPQLKDWSQHRTMIADVDGDLREDVIWIYNAANSSVHVGLARGH